MTRLIVNWFWKSTSAVTILSVLAFLAPGGYRWLAIVPLIAAFAVALLHLLNLLWTRHEMRHPERLSRPEVFAAMAETLEAAGQLEAAAAAARCAGRRQ
jgi:hypothetical protein